MGKAWLKVLAVVIAMLAGTAAQAADAGETPASDGKLRIVVFGAHPDDCEVKSAGVAALWAEQGHHVKFVSVTNGDIGHAEQAGGPLARRRAAEVKAAAEVLGIESEVLDIHDGELMPTLENREKFTRVIREWKADIVMGHRPNDYHPDHRYTGVLMQDAAFMVTVPYYLPLTPALERNPVFLYLSDNFQKPTPFEPTMVVPIDRTLEKKARAIWQIESQIESLWGTGGFVRLAPVPQDGPERETRRLAEETRRKQAGAAIANKYRDRLVELYGEEKGRAAQYAEAFELCEYGRRVTVDELKGMFPTIE